jgi:hypothetical protein
VDPQEVPKKKLALFDNECQEEFWQLVPGRASPEISSVAKMLLSN